MKSGIKNKFIDAYSANYPIVYSAVYTKIGNADDTEDLCQDIFLTLFRKFDEVKNIRKWLFITLRYYVMNHIRKMKPEANVDDVFADVGLTFVNGFRDSRIIIADAFENTESYKDETDRQVFDLVAFYNFSYSEAGKELGLSKRQIEYRYTQIVQRIIDDLKNKGINNIEDLL